MIYEIVIRILEIFIFAVIIFFLIEVIVILKSLATELISVLKNINTVTDNLIKEQEFVDSIVFSAKEAGKTIEGTIEAVESIRKKYNTIRGFWGEKRKNIKNKK